VPAPLEEVQGFLASVFRREDPVEGDAALAASCGAHVSGNDRLTPAEQVDIYRRQFWMRHVDSLIEDHIALRYILGDDAFEAFCHAYLTEHPPRLPSLRDLGADIPAFAEGYSGFPADQRDLCVDMARYENAFIEIFDGPEPPPLDAAKLRDLPASAWETARIVLHPLLTRMTVRYPVHKLRFAVKSEETPPLSEHPRAAEPIHLAIFRKDLTIHYEVLTPEAARLLDLLAQGVPLVPACAAVAEGATRTGGAARAAELEAAVGAWFQQWTSWGIIVDIAVAPDAPT